MLQQMRQMRMFVFWFVAIVFVVGFVFLSDGMNVGSTSTSDTNVVAVVNGEKVSSEVYNRYVTQLAEMERQRFQRDELSSADYDRIEGQAWDGLLADLLVRQEAKKLGIRAADDEIVSTLTQSPPAWIRQRFTDEQGQFDAAQFQQAINDPAYPWGADEQYLRLALPSIKLEQMVRAGANVSEDDVRREFARRSQRTTVRYVGVPLSTINVDGFTPTEAQNRAYYDAHPERFGRGETVTLEVIKLDKKASALDEDDAMADAREAIQSEKNGEPFATIAEQVSDDASAAMGGDMGWTQTANLPEAMREPATKLEAGQTSEPFRAERGFVILHADSVRMGAMGREVKLRQILLVPKISGETLDSLRLRAADAGEKAQKDFEGAARELGVVPQKLDPAESFGFLPGIGFAKRLTDWAFKASPGDVSEPYGTDDAILIARLVEKKPKGPRPFEEVQDQVKFATMNEERLRRARTRLEPVVAAVRSGTPMDVAARAAGLEVQTPTPFTFYESVAGVGSANEFNAVAAALAPGSTSNIVETPSGVYVMQVIGRDPFDETAFKNDRDTQYQNLLGRRSTETYDAWVAGLRERAKIEDRRRPRV